MNDSMRFYKSFYEAVKDLSPEIRVEIYDAIFEYGLNGKTIELSPIANAIFHLIKLQIDANNIKRANGKQGGRPKKETKQKAKKTKDKPKDNLNKTELKPSNNQNKPDHNQDVIKEKPNESTTLQKESINYQEIIDMYNNTCVSLPKVTILSDERKKTIKARLKQYSINDFQTLFYKAEDSDFLKGKAGGNWSANFDWLLNAKNIVKVLDGNYDNKINQRSRENILNKWMNA